MKRMKALDAPKHGLIALVIDGHESNRSQVRGCEECLEAHRDNPERATEYYHRNVTAQLVFERFSLLIDAEPQLPGEGELTAAKRLYARVRRNYARAFEVVLVDALYGGTPFLKQVLESEKDFVVVFKSNAGNVYERANQQLDEAPAHVRIEQGKCLRQSQISDLEYGLGQSVRAVRSLEIKMSKEVKTTQWQWVTSLSPSRASMQTVADLGHARWTIENEGFNESSTRWFSDHVYRHDGSAILNFWLLCMLAFNMFMCFFFRNLKEIYRQACSMKHIAQMISAELYHYRPQRKPP
jgi:hypothetical protein